MRRLRIAQLLHVLRDSVLDLTPRPSPTVQTLGTTGSWASSVGGIDDAGSAVGRLVPAPGRESENHADLSRFRSRLTRERARGASSSGQGWRRRRWWRWRRSRCRRWQWQRQRRCSFRRRWQRSRPRDGGRRRHSTWDDDRRRPWHRVDRTRQPAPLSDSEPATFQPQPGKRSTAKRRRARKGSSRHGPDDSWSSVTLNGSRAAANDRPPRVRATRLVDRRVRLVARVQHAATSAWAVSKLDGRPGARLASC
jgi:hypothetical protein